MSKPWSLVLVLGVPLAACSTSDDVVLPPIGGGKTDLSESVPILGALTWDTPVSGELDEDLEFHGYTFEAKANTALTLEITRAGSSSALDTTMFLYGPETEELESGPLLAEDNDSGFDKKSKIAGFRTTEAGRYTVVVGTPDGKGRGDYSLLLGCDEGGCEQASGTIVCRLTRLDGIAGGGEPTVEARISDFAELEEDGADSDNLEVFDGAYGFSFTGTIDGDDLEIDVFFWESNHVQDETGSMSCGTSLSAGSHIFCEEPIVIDKNLGLQDDDGNELPEEVVHAMDFSCELSL